MNFWPERKVIALMEIAFHYGCLYARKHKGKKRNDLWLAFKIDKLANNLKYINPDPRCTHPVNLDVLDHCWGYAHKIDKGEEIDMNELCNGCEFLSVEAKNEQVAPH